MLLKEHQTRAEGRILIDPVRELESEDNLREQKREAISFQVFQRRIRTLKEQIMRRDTALHELKESVADRMSQSRDEGFAAGVEQGRKDREAELEQAFELLAEMEQAFRRETKDFHVSAEDELIELAGWMTSTVLAREFKLDRQRLPGLLGRLLHYYNDQPALRFHLHPGDRAALHDTPPFEELCAKYHGRLDWVASPEVPPGSCRLELPTGIVDTAPQEMVQHLVHELQQSRRSSGDTA